MRLEEPSTLPERLTSAPVSDKPPVWEWVVPVVCCLLLVAQLSFVIVRLSQTCDEPTYLYAGYRYWKCGDLGYGAEHPPLAKLVAAAPLLFSEIKVDCHVPARDEAFAALDWQYENNWQSMLLRGRIAVSLFAVALCLLVWMAARRYFGLVTATIATTFLVFDPTFLAQGSMIATDMVITFTFFMAVYAYYLFTRKHSLPWLLLAGIAVGLALASKHSGALIAPTLVALAIGKGFLESKENRSRWKGALRELAWVAAVALVTLGTLWAAYQFRFAARANGAPLVRIDAGRSVLTQVSTGLSDLHILPEAYVEGLLRTRELSKRTHPTFLLGRLLPTGEWYFFPLHMLIKYSLGVLLIAAIGISSVWHLFRKWPRETLFLVIPLAMFLLGTFLLNRMNSNIRHLLPVLPFLLILGSAGSLQLARRYRWGVYLLGAALLLHIGSSLHAAPFYLSYANELWGGPAEVYRRLPNNDMGEAWKEVREYVRHRPGTPCWVAQPYLMNIHEYDIPCQNLWGGEGPEPIPPRLKGIVILSSMFLEASQEQWLEPITRTPDGEWRQPSARLAGSAMLVYEGDFDVPQAAGMTRAMAARRALNHGRIPEALILAHDAVAFAPNSLLARYEYCLALAAAGERETARFQCSVTKDMLRDSAEDANWTTTGNGEALAEAVQARTDLERNRIAAALDHARRGIQLSPRSGIAWFEYCRALVANRLESSTGCSTAMTMLTNRQVRRVSPPSANLGVVDLLEYAVSDARPRNFGPGD